MYIFLTEFRLEPKRGLMPGQEQHHSSRATRVAVTYPSVTEISRATVSAQKTLRSRVARLESKQSPNQSHIAMDSEMTNTDEGMHWLS